MRRVFSISAACLALACQTVLGFEEFEAEIAAGGSAGAGGAGTGGTSGAGTAGSTGGAAGSTGGTAGSTGGTAGASCPSTSAPGKDGPVMVQLMQPNGTCFWIDKTEVTREQYERFLASSPPTTSQPAFCDWNTSFDYSACLGDAGVIASPSHPVSCVDYCDALAFCNWANKTLCTGDYAAPTDSNGSRWYASCSSNDANEYPYTASFNSEYCNGDDRAQTGCGSGSCMTMPVGTLTNCATPAGVQDLSGNVAEWVNECNSTAGATDQCRVRGGAVNSKFDQLRCPTTVSRARSYSNAFVGFRCCADSATD